MTQLAANVRGFGQIYGELYGALLRVPGVRFLASNAAMGSVPTPLPGSDLWRVCAELRRDVLAGRLDA